MNMPPRRSPAPLTRNIVGAKIRSIRKARKIRQVDVVARLQRMGWDISESLYSNIEAGRRQLLDWEVELLLKSIGASWSDLER